MILKLAGLCLLVLLVEARDEESTGGLNFPFTRIDFSSPIFQTPDGMSSLWGMQPRVPKIPKAIEENQYPNLETMDVEDEKPEPNPTSPFQDVLSSNSWLTSFHKKNFNDIFKMFVGIPRWNPWWQKEHVCVETKEEDTMDAENDENDQQPGFFSTSSINLQTCYQTNTKYECVEKIKTQKESKTVTVRYQCCYGYQRMDSGDCEKIELIPMVERIKESSGSEFLKLAKDMKTFLTEQNITVFLPTDEAFADFAERMLETNQLDLNVDASRRRRSANSITNEDLINVHISKGFIELTPDERYPSLYENSSLAIKEVYDNVNRKSEFLVNCAKVLSSNYATNGMVHTIDRVLMPASRSIMDIIKSRKNFSTLRLLLEKTGLTESLEGNIWTLLAPTNKAFDKFQRKYPLLMQKLLRGDTCTANLLKQHMTYEFCSAELEMGLAGVKSSMGDFLRTSKINKTRDISLDFIDGENVAFYIEKAGVSEADIIASNGVIHAIDDILIPDSALPITLLMETKNLSLFYELIEKADMTDEVNNLSNVTFIIPTDKAIKNFLKNDERSKHIEAVFSRNITKGEKEELRSFIYHHVIPGGLQSCDLDNNLMRTPLNKNSPLRVNLYSTNPLSSTYNRATVDCAWLQHFDAQQCDNILHQINRPLMDTNESIMERIKNDSRLYMLHKILVDTEIESILHKKNNITFVAPTNKAFEKMSPEIYNRLLNDKKMVTRLMEPHIFEDVTCCAGLYNTFLPFVKSLRAINGEMSKIAKNKIGATTIVSCDHMGTNGVLHLTDKLPAISGKPNIDIMLYGVDF